MYIRSRGRLTTQKNIRELPTTCTVHDLYYNLRFYMKLQAESVDTSCSDMYSQAIQELERQTDFNTKATDAWNRVVSLNVSSRNVIENNLKQYDTQAKQVNHA